MHKKGVSIILCCYNSSSRIGATLNHLQKINSHGIAWEVILVDNGSDDNTTSFSNEIWQSNPVSPLILVEEKKKGLMNARIKGASTSSYEYLSFIDDDNWVESEWINKVYSILEKNPQLAACGGSAEAVFESTPPDWFSEFSISFATGMQQNKSGFVQPEKGYLWGAGLTVRKKAWDELFSSGFASLLPGRSGKSLTAGEDSELCLAWIIRGWQLWYEESLTLQHFIPSGRLHLNYLFKMYEGFGKAEVILSLYRGAINKNKANKNTWLLQSLTSIKNLFFAGVKKIFSAEAADIRNRAHWKMQKAYVIELITERKKYLAAQKKITNFITTRDQTL